MHDKFEGVVLRTIKYSDNLMITDIYTRQQGRVSFLLPITHSKRSRVRSVLFQPLSIVSFIAPRRAAKRLVRITDAQPSLLYSTIPYDIVKSSIALYLAELLTHSLHEEERDDALYNYIESALTWFDAADEGYADFHLVFMSQLLRFLGIAPNIGQVRANSYFDMQAGSIVHEHPLHPHFLLPPDTASFARLLSCDFLSVRALALNGAVRCKFLAALEEYYRLHLPSMPVLRSGEVLRELFRF